MMLLTDSLWNFDWDGTWTFVTFKLCAHYFDCNTPYKVV